jgi:hypothetical protein
LNFAKGAEIKPLRRTKHLIKIMALQNHPIQKSGGEHRENIGRLNNQTAREQQKRFQPAKAKEQHKEIGQTVGHHGTGKKQKPGGC